MEQKLVTLPPSTEQMCLRNAGSYSTSYLGNNIFYLYEAIVILLAVVGEEYMQKNYQNWEKIRKELVKTGQMARIIKLNYDMLEEKKFDKEPKTEREKINRLKFYKASKKMPLIEIELHKLFYFLLTHTTLQNKVIPSEAFKYLERAGYKTLHLDRTRSPMIEEREENAD